MTTPIWQWRLSAITRHIALLVLTFPIAVFGIYWTALTQLSMQAGFDFTQEWIENPTVVLP